MEGVKVAVECGGGGGWGWSGYRGRWRCGGGGVEGGWLWKRGGAMEGRRCPWRRLWWRCGGGGGTGGGAVEGR